VVSPADHFERTVEGQRPAEQVGRLRARRERRACLQLAGKLRRLAQRLLQRHHVDAVHRRLAGDLPELRPIRPHIRPDAAAVEPARHLLQVKRAALEAAVHAQALEEQRRPRRQRPILGHERQAHRSVLLRLCRDLQRLVPGFQAGFLDLEAGRQIRLEIELGHLRGGVMKLDLLHHHPAQVERLARLALRQGLGNGQRRLLHLDPLRADQANRPRTASHERHHVRNDLELADLHQVVLADKDATRHRARRRQQVHVQLGDADRLVELLRGDARDLRDERRDRHDERHEHGGQEHHENQPHPGPERPSHSRRHAPPHGRLR
jgi:hypothetical protein